MSTDKDEPFLTRWARQKRATNTTPPATSQMAEPHAPEPEEPVDLSKLPRIEDLTANSDLTAFLRKGVPEELQRLALRRMWSLDPAICDFVEMAENQWDFNAPGGIHGLYEAIEEGTDVSVWLAQATQSVIEQRPAKDSHVAALQQTDSPPAEIDSSETGVALPLGQPETPEHHDQASEKQHPSTSRLLRRRHGGALPE